MSGTGSRLISAFARIIATVCCVAVMVCSWGMGVAVFGQDSGPPFAKDAIFARKTLMDSINENMDEIETMLAPGGKFEAAEAREHVDNISVMLMAFPHLFPRETNQWKKGADRDPATDTFASPEVWTRFSDFYERAKIASRLALDASQAKHGNEFKSLMAQLRAACNSCHEAYLKAE